MSITQLNISSTLDVTVNAVPSLQIFVDLCVSFTSDHTDVRNCENTFPVR